MERSKNFINQNINTLIIILFVVGIFINLFEKFKVIANLTTPIFLLLISATTVFTFYSKDKKQKNYLLYCVLFIYYFSFFIEVIGVGTSFPFGGYEYGKSGVLGPLVFNTPVLMGFIWVLVTFSIVSILQRLGIWKIDSKNSFFELFLGAILLVVLDIFIEPVAIILEFWKWDTGGLPPFSNYIGWFIVGFVNLLVCKIFNIKCLNLKLANTIGVMLFIFFVSLYVLFYVF